MQTTCTAVTWELIGTLTSTLAEQDYDLETLYFSPLMLSILCYAHRTAFMASCSTLCDPHRRVTGTRRTHQHNPLHRLVLPELGQAFLGETD